MQLGLMNIKYSKLLNYKNNKYTKNIRLKKKGKEKQALLISHSMRCGASFSHAFFFFFYSNQSTQTVSKICKVKMTVKCI